MNLNIGFNLWAWSIRTGGSPVQINAVFTCGVWKGEARTHKPHICCQTHHVCSWEVENYLNQFQRMYSSHWPALLPLVKNLADLSAGNWSIKSRRSCMTKGTIIGVWMRLLFSNKACSRQSFLVQPYGQYARVNRYSLQLQNVKQLMSTQAGD